MAADEPAPAAPTAEQAAQAQEVAVAAGEAAAAEPTREKATTAARRSARKTADKVKLELSDDDCERIAQMVVDVMDTRGAFDAPPEPVIAAPPPGASTPQEAAPTAAEQVPQRSSFAERFLG